MILGTDLTGATSVTFNGEAAKFKAVSATEISATVPSGATTGAVEVKTSKGTLGSNAAFGMLPQIVSLKPTSGPVGAKVEITGISLTQTNEVTFDGVVATDVGMNSDTR
jgi:hypothetical protein